jgi:hypothetical protein
MAIGPWDWRSVNWRFGRTNLRAQAKSAAGSVVSYVTLLCHVIFTDLSQAVSKCWLAR